MSRQGNPEKAQKLKDMYVAAIQTAKNPGDDDRDLTGGNKPDDQRNAYETA